MSSIPKVWIAMSGLKHDLLKHDSSGNPLRKMAIALSDRHFITDTNFTRL
ncbi:MAG: hypothetical protein WBA57_23175 [Elainellaceae cyanobacterium]